MQETKESLKSLNINVASFSNISSENTVKQDSKCERLNSTQLLRTVEILVDRISNLTKVIADERYDFNSYRRGNFAQNNSFRKWKSYQKG